MILKANQNYILTYMKLSTIPIILRWSVSNITSTTKS